MSLVKVHRHSTLASKFLERGCNEIMDVIDLTLHRSPYLLFVAGAAGPVRQAAGVVRVCAYRQSRPYWLCCRHPGASSLIYPPLDPRSTCHSSFRSVF